ncbi:S8 family serine peptidase [Nocardia abscessus]|uniref:S8 family serine peptidase n=1 Tax=Nocardia abscessus TaxID=120957 RepID=UPI001895C8FE|nr:S8 family serine peptidase [Nocardia abscessus]MBF6222800.1 S8 family serine peptidase [Nocardia abscessus]
MTRMDIALQHAYSVWRTELGYAERGEGRDSGEVRHRVVSVVVEYTGDPGGLREAGLRMGFDSGGKVSGLIELAALARLDAVPGVESIQLVPKVRELLDGTVKELRVPWKVSPGTFGGRGAGVIVAVVDSGIDIFHESFRKPGGKTRILELWDQGASTGGGGPPTGFLPIGRVYSENDINVGLATGGVFATIDERGHGTHVAGIAAGNGRQDDKCNSPGYYVGVAPEADLVIVKRVGEPAVRDALRWCAAAPQRLHMPDKPVVINCSFGSDAGPHDGTDVTATFVDEILRPPSGPPAGLAVVASAGNAGSAEIHESGTVPANSARTVSFYVPDGSKRADLLDIWYTGAASLTIEIIAPASGAAGSNSTGAIPPGSTDTRPIGPMTITVTSSTPQPKHGGKREIRITITVPSTDVVRPGIWQLKFAETAGAAAAWDAWFQVQTRDGFPTFHLPGDDLLPRRREHTIHAPATSRNAITVTNYDDGNGELAASSSRGHPNQAAVLAGERKPTIAAPGTAVAAPRSRNDPDKNSSCCDQKVLDKSGTSMAAPHVTGLVALMFQKNRDLTFEQVRAHLQQSARVDGIPAAEVPPVVEPATGIRGNHLWGAGKVDATAALAGIPARAGGGGGTPVPPFADDIVLGYTPPDLPSRIAYWQQRFGQGPGLMLLAALASAHVDEILRLINGNRRAAVVWRRNGGHRLVRHLLYRPTTGDVLVPRSIDGCDAAVLIERFTVILEWFGSARLRADLERFRDFLAVGPGSELARLDQVALAYGGGR